MLANGNPGLNVIGKGLHKDSTLRVCVCLCTQVCSLYPTCCSWCCAASPYSSWRHRWDSTPAWEESALGGPSVHYLEVGLSNHVFRTPCYARDDNNVCPGGALYTFHPWFWPKTYKLMVNGLIWWQNRYKWDWIDVTLPTSVFLPSLSFTFLHLRYL